ncbi:natural killer cells antigen CD94-like isoform X2 [Tamandua tetradactyla]|uniref:natural killer cells antigen CD94-like isoform X2 n=1 Tax=Tamandua tetradactyla TaxID=48850 RepID=UPI004053F077
MAASQIAPWSLISGTLGAMCLSLMVTLGILFKIFYMKENIQSTLPPGPTLELQEGSDCCSCREKWIGYLCNCYFLSDEYKSWTESRDFCASQNSSLLQLKSRDELGFANFLQYSYWIGLSYNDARGAWLWEDGSTPSSNLFSIHLTPNPGSCMSYSSNRGVLDENCVEKKRYICEKQLM